MREDVTYVIDTGPLLSLVMGLPSNVLATASFIQNNYRKAKDYARSKNTLITKLGSEFTGEFIEQLTRKIEAVSSTYNIIKKCLAGAECIVPVQVLNEMRKYNNRQEIRDFMKLVGTPATRHLLVEEHNSAMQYKNRRDQEINAEFFEDLVGSSFSWKKVDLYQDHGGEFQNWYRSALYGIRYLSDVDARLLAYTAYLNSIGEPAVIVTADRRLMQAARLMGVPYYYVYEGKIANHENLGRLSFSGLARKAREHLKSTSRSTI